MTTNEINTKITTEAAARDLFRRLGVKYFQLDERDRLLIWSKNRWWRMKRSRDYYGWMLCCGEPFIDLAEQAGKWRLVKALRWAVIVLESALMSKAPGPGLIWKTQILSPISRSPTSDRRQSVRPSDRQRTKEKTNQHCAPPEDDLIAADRRLLWATEVRLYRVPPG